MWQNMLSFNYHRNQHSTFHKLGLLANSLKQTDYIPGFMFMVGSAVLALLFLVLVGRTTEAVTNIAIRLEL